MKVGISGAGIAGLTAAIALQQAGIAYTLYEAASEIKPVGAGIALAGNAIKAFKKLGIEEAIMSKGRLLDAFVINDPTGKLISKTDSRSVGLKYRADNFTIHRADLHEALLAFVNKKNLRINKRCINFEENGNRLVLHFADGSTDEVDYLLACDGIHSPIRKKLLPQASPRYAQYTCWRAVVEMPHLELNEASETWGTTGRFGIVPLNKNQVYWFACIPAKAQDPVLKNYTSTDLLRHFDGFHAPIPEILLHTRTEQLIHGDICDLKPLNRFAFGKILLMGDAAHATTPNMGQGACQAIEDAAVLASELEHNHASFENLFLAFEKRRLERTSSIIVRSHKIGQVAQIQNAWLAAVRNFVLRALPEEVNEKGLKSLLDVEF